MIRIDSTIKIDSTIRIDSTPRISFPPQNIHIFKLIFKTVAPLSFCLAQGVNQFVGITYAVNPFLGIAYGVNLLLGTKVCRIAYC